MKHEIAKSAQVQQNTDGPANFSAALLIHYTLHLIADEE